MQGFVILKQVVHIVATGILMDKLLFNVKRGVIIHEGDVLGLNGVGSFPGRGRSFYPSLLGRERPRGAYTEGEG
jgi:hypothetical protein